MTPVARLIGIWWGAVVLLVVNDHVLKQAGLLPGWLTGKLSDLAGLVVAPVLAVVVFRARTRRPRALAFAAVVAWFCAVKLSPVAARATEAAMVGIGMRWRLWCDPSDLVALVALPLAWRITIAWTARSTTPASTRWRRAVPVVAGAAACLATSAAPPGGYHTMVFLRNMTEETLERRGNSHRRPP